MIRYVAALVLILPAAAGAQSVPAAPAKAAPASTKTGLDPDKVRCIKTPIIGTLSQFTKTCMTNREWDRARAEVQRMRSPSACSGGAACSGG